ncbi:PIG-L family deacetylase [Silvibacterium sp.]|uniref:PIG-L family deacetylase n=1 Tax=Silvibacterium sp. TaxID=1964179 RepID=UPI0039E6D7DC
MPKAALSHIRTASALAMAGFVTVSPFVSSLAAQVTPWQTSIVASADQQTLPEDRGADGLSLTLRKLHTWASLMMIVAHPDDEDSGMLTLESRGAGARTAILTLTRGEGGQNAMSGEADDALGLIRTNELLLADQYSGTEQFFSRVADYGFSKTLDEAHRKWGRDRVLYDAVRAVRLYRPLVVTSVFTGNITDGHGHHQMSGEAVQEVFRMAGDPNVFPDQIAAGLRPWSPVKVYARLPFFSITSKGMFDYATNKWAPVRFYDYVQGHWSDKAPTADVEIPEGTYDPILGRSYVQMARDGWALQKSQYGGGNPPLPGDFSVAYHRYGSRVQTPAAEGVRENGFFDGIDTSLVGIASLAHGDTTFLTAGLKEIDQHVMTATFNYLPSSPVKIAPELALGAQRTQALLDQVNASGLSADDKANVAHELEIKLTQFNTALAEALGLKVRALVIPEDGSKDVTLTINAEETRTAVTPSEQFTVRLHVTGAEPWSTGGNLKLTKTWLASSGDTPWHVERAGSPGMDVAASHEGDVLYRVTVPRNAPPTEPYFTRPSTAQPYYDVSDPKLLNQPFAPYPLAGWAEFDYNGVPIRIGQVVQTNHREHGYGNLFEPLVVMPRLAVNLSAHAGVVPLDAKSFPLAVSVRNYQPDNADGTLHLELPQGWTAEPASQAFHLAPNQSVTETVTIHPGALAAQSYDIHAIAQSGNYEYSTGVERAGYPGLRPYFLDRQATYSVHGADVKVAPGLRVGYIMGTGDEVPEALTQLGVTTHLITAAELASGDLSGYSAILVGIRAYSNRSDLVAANARLLDYAHNGGVVVVQYQNPGLSSSVGPYPYSVPGDAEKVVDESDAVKLLAPSSPLFQWPNRISGADFSGWEEEQGHSFASSWDPHYIPLTEVADPGQDPQRGGLLVAPYGKGIYIYEAYALYRQFPAAVPGAYRILANLISLSANPNRSTMKP